jgi:hypothetical protein
LKKKAKIETTVLALLLLAAGSIWYYYTHPELGSARAASFLVAYKPMGAESPRIHHDRVQAAKDTEYGPTIRDIFNRDLPPPPPPPPPVQVVRVPAPGDADFVPPVAPPPPPPKLPLKFFGSGSVEGGTARRAFLTNGDSVYVAGEGDTVLGRYRIIKIGHVNLEFEEISTGRHGFAHPEDLEPTL